MIASFLVFYLVLSIEAIPQQHKAEILVDQGVNVQEINGQKFAGLLGGNGGVNGLYKNGKVSAASGSQGEHQIFKAAGPNGQIQSGSIKNGDRTGQFQSSNKDQLTVDAGNPSKITGNLHVANGKPQP